MTLTLQVLGPDDHALLCAVPDGLFAHPIDPEAARIACCFLRLGRRVFARRHPSQRR